uniref:Uncharacterized protein n=1 Tax=Octactis speculum TaxID=3111310 RepID=A0A7S2HKN3_9STRA|mmetsp:Transcript_6905/g.8560  ORF Transcript_6905/g.8560 Transcript_6905/m.8560 type:complete len:141 (+) Transcript_6905:2-424(+)
MVVQADDQDVLRRRISRCVSPHLDLFQSRCALIDRDGYPHWIDEMDSMAVDTPGDATATHAEAPSSEGLTSAVSDERLAAVDHSPPPNISSSRLWQFLRRAECEQLQDYSLPTIGFERPATPPLAFKKFRRVEVGIKIKS